MNKKVKKLIRQLKAAGIKVLYSKEFDCYYTTGGERTICVSNDENLPTFDEVKEFVNFKGNDWDGVLKRLKNDCDWSPTYPSTDPQWTYDFLNRRKDPIFDFSVQYGVELKLYTNGWVSATPHKTWKFLDKIDAAKAKGGKQTVKFKGCEYEFEFPIVDKPTITEEVNELPESTDNLKKSNNNHTIVVGATSNNTTPDWAKVTNWDSIKDTKAKGFRIDSEYNEDGVIINFFKGRIAEALATEKQARQSLAFSKLTQIHSAMMEGSDLVRNVVDVNGVWLQSVDLYEGRYSFDEYLYKDLLKKPHCTPFEIQFYTEEQRSHFIKHNQDLINQYIGL